MKYFYSQIKKYFVRKIKNNYPTPSYHFQKNKYILKI